MKPYFEKLFRLKENNTTIGTEVIAGLVTFATMSYITCVQPAILSGRFFGISTNMPFDALLTTTCLTAALGCFLMGLYANYPIALAAGMGENILMVITLIPACSVLVGSEAGPDAAWQLAWGVVFIAGLVFLILSFLNIRKLLIGAVSNSMKNAIAVGIGLFIALLGLENGKMIIGASGHYILNPLHSTETFIFLVGLTVIAVLQVRRIRGAILLGMLFSTLVALLLGVIRPTALLGWPANPLPVIGQADIAGVFSHFADLLPLLIIFIYMDVFDTLGTVIGVGARAGLLKNGHLPRVERVFSVDALSTVVGAAAGMSTVTCFVESSAGVESGGRTGLTAVVCGLAFLLVLFFYSVVADDHRVYADYRAGVGDRRRDDGAECHVDRLAGLQRGDSIVSDHHRHPVQLQHCRRNAAGIHQLSGYQIAGRPRPERRLAELSAGSAAGGLSVFPETLIWFEGKEC